MILDTNALSAWAEGLSGVEVALRPAGQLVVPSIVLGESYFGIRQPRHRARYEQWLGRYLPFVKIAVVTAATADDYAGIRLEHRQAGSPIPSSDVRTAALVRQHPLPLQNNDDHFDCVAGVCRIDF